MSQSAASEASSTGQRVSFMNGVMSRLSRIERFDTYAEAWRVMIGPQARWPCCGLSRAIRLPEASASLLSGRPRFCRFRPRTVADKLPAAWSGSRTLAQVVAKGLRPHVRRRLLSFACISHSHDVSRSRLKVSATVFPPDAVIRTSLAPPSACRAAAGSVAALSM
jgi:hypothetical protein